ncbi:MAG: CHASE domain-containing protein [Alphaproteobacteria bacterium]|nr:CHASE domain-containing protein [Alphaproteobacteria bacterium]
MPVKPNIRVHILISLICLGLTAGVAIAAEVIAQRRAESAYQAIVADSRSAMLMRIESYLLSLNGLAAFYDASDNVSGADWATYVEALDIERTLPGILGLGLVVPSNGPDLMDILQTARDAGEPELVVHPETGRPDKMIIRYIEPGGINSAARGLDISFEKQRRTAALLARDTGQPQMTGPVALVQRNTETWGALLLRPIYDVTPIPATEAARRAAHIGWVYAPYFTNDALSGLSANQGDLFDVTVTDAGQTIFHSGQADDRSQYVRSEDIPIFGRTWTVTWASSSAFDALHHSPATYIVLFAGFGTTLLLWFYLRALANRETEINRLVEKKTRALSDRVLQNRAVIENSVFGVMHLDSDGVIRSANAASVVLLGLPKTDLKGRRLADMVTLDDPDADTGTPQMATALRDGQQRKFEMQTNVWHRSNGDVVQSVLLRDVTEETQSQQAISDAEQRWNLALQGAELGVFDVDLKTNTSVVSDTWRQMLEVPAGIPLDAQAHFFSRIHPDDLEVLQAADLGAIRGDTPRSISEFRVRMPDDSWRWLRSDAVVVQRDADGTALRLIGSQTDITALRTAETARSHSEELLRLVIDRAPVGTAILDQNGTLTRTNGALSQLTGHAEDALNGSHLDMILMPEDREPVLSAIVDLQGDSTRTYRGEHRIRCADGDIRWGLMKVSWAFDPAQGTEIYIVQINDITLEKRAEQIKGEFIATISHELRTPLTSIKGALGLMVAKRADDPSAPSGRLLEIASSNTNRLISLVNDILDLEKISAGKMDYNIQRHDAAALVAEALENNRPLLLRNKLTFRVVDRSDGAQILVDSDRMAQVLSNLLSNACKFAPPRSAILVEILRSDNMVRFNVTDRGPGVPAAFRSRIFGAFSQADSSDTRQKGGTGLGLNISRQMVEKMGGEIGFDSEPDVRTTFHFTCPQAGLPQPQPDVPQATTDAQSKKAVLHLEDDEDFAEVIVYGLSDLADITKAATLSEARLRMTERNYDLILVDWVLRDGDVSSLLDELLIAQPTARIVVLSSSDTARAETRVDLAMTKSRDGLPGIVANLKQEMMKTAAA